MSVKPEELSRFSDMEMDELMKLIRPETLRGEQDYLSSWLSAKPGQMRSLSSMELDPDKRIDTVLSALLKEPPEKVVPFKKPRK